jgi:hypothetical protein
MVDLPQKKVGIVACSGEELPEGTLTRLAALKVLEQLRPKDTVTICLPLFLAGGEGDRAFARFYPTIAVDGCQLRCAARATEMYSGKPAAELNVEALAAEMHLPRPQGLRKLDPAGVQIVDEAAQRLASLVDDLLGKRWDRRKGAALDAEADESAAADGEIDEPIVATCACGSGIPVQKVLVGGKTLTMVALPLLFEQFRASGKPPDSAAMEELLERVKIYNLLAPEREADYKEMLSREYAAYCLRAGGAQ